MPYDFRAPKWSSCTIKDISNTLHGREKLIMAWEMQTFETEANSHVHVLMRDEKEEGSKVKETTRHMYTFYLFLFVCFHFV